MILFNPIVEILALPDNHWLQCSPRAVLQSAFTITGDDRLPVRLAAVNDNTIRTAKPCQSFSQETFGRQQRLCRKLFRQGFSA